MNDLRIVFMGTPDFAVGILDAIIKSNYNVVGVITAADKPAGRGQKVKFSAVKEYALENNLPLLQPTNLKSSDFLDELRSLNANLQIVVAFRMLPKVVWDMPKFGTFNLHASLLPEYRGAAPINWAIINGENKTGVTTFFIDDKIDTGDIILNKEIEITEQENAGILHDKLMNLGSIAVIETLEKIKNNNITTISQPDHTELKTAYKLNKENCKIDWNKDSKTIYNLIRGLSPYPAAWCFLDNNNEKWNIKIYESVYKIEEHSFNVGKIIISKKSIKVATIDGFIEIIAMQLPGKRKMNVSELLNGLQLSDDANML